MIKKLSKLDKPIFIITLVLFIFGLIMILSSSSMESYMRYNFSPYHYFFRELIFLLIGSICFFVTICFPTKNYKKMYNIFLFRAIFS